MRGKRGEERGCGWEKEEGIRGGKWKIGKMSKARDWEDEACRVAVIDTFLGS